MVVLANRFCSSLSRKICQFFGFFFFFFLEKGPFLRTFAKKLIERFQKIFMKQNFFGPFVAVFCLQIVFL